MDPSQDAGTDSSAPDATQPQVGQITYRVTGFELPMGPVENVPITLLDLVCLGDACLVDQIRFRMLGTGSWANVDNLALHDENGELFLRVTEIEEEYANFLFDPPLRIEHEGFRMFQLRLDVQPPACRTLAFDVHRDWDIQATGETSGQDLNIAENAQSEIPEPMVIQGTHVAFAVSPDNPGIGDVHKHADDHLFMQLTVTSQRDINVLQAPIFAHVIPEPTTQYMTINHYFDERLWILTPENQWNQVGGVIDVITCQDGPCYYDMNDTFFIPGDCQAHEIKFTMDTDPSQPTGHQLTAGTDPLEWIIEDPETHSLVEPEHITGTTITGGTQTTIP